MSNENVSLKLQYSAMGKLIHLGWTNVTENDRRLLVKAFKIKSGITTSANELTNTVRHGRKCILKIHNKNSYRSLTFGYNTSDKVIFIYI